MTPKQQLKSLEKKMQRIQDAKPDFDFNLASQNYHDIIKYYELKQEHFILEFNINHCQTCGKKL